MSTASGARGIGCPGFDWGISDTTATTRLGAKSETGGGGDRADEDYEEDDVGSGEGVIGSRLLDLSSSCS